MIDSVLIANRGEIAVRVIRSAREMGIRTIAVYSELDRDGLHVSLADEAWNIGPAPAAESYLNIERVLEAARTSGAAAVHPGYGFLSESPEFAQAVMDAGLVWVGPPPAAIDAMGDKIASRVAAEQAGVPAVPGTLEPVDSVDEVRKLAEDFGLPVAIKAAHGGGGKGLRVVRNDAELSDAFEAARREADAYFGSPEVYVEKYLHRPRHIEAQIFFDGHGNGAFLGERDCSVQRRHQKLIEETPSPSTSEEVRARLQEAALAIGRACDYQSSGTVEFLVDENDDVYFLEMNTRLQVEHTVTEAVTGIDLVAEQLRVASGEPLSFSDVTPRGHAIQFRINAEDPSRNFLPTPGRIADYREPAGFGIRVDSGIQVGTNVSPYYDNLIAKLVVWGRDREEAIRRGRSALREFVIRGTSTTIPAHLVVLDNPTFLAGNAHTRLVEEEVDLSHLERQTSPALPEDPSLIQREMTVEVGGRRFVVRYWVPEAELPSAGRRTAPRRRPPKLDRGPATAGEDAGVIAAPMQGTIVKVHVKAGERVEAGDPICVLEAMKMENEVRTPVPGEVIDLRVEPGDSVASGAVVAIVR